jgi:hypothetical protein
VGAPLLLRTVLRRGFLLCPCRRALHSGALLRADDQLRASALLCTRALLRPALLPSGTVLLLHARLCSRVLRSGDLLPLDAGQFHVAGRLIRTWVRRPCLCPSCPRFRSMRPRRHSVGQRSRPAAANRPRHGGRKILGRRQPQLILGGLS